LTIHWFADIAIGTYGEDQLFEDFSEFLAPGFGHRSEA
jgi:hypothetical protein